MSYNAQEEREIFFKNFTLMLEEQAKFPETVSIDILLKMNHPLVEYTGFCKTCNKLRGTCAILCPYRKEMLTQELLERFK